MDGFESEEEEELYYLHTISQILGALISPDPQESIFNAKTLPSISLKDYLTRLKQRTKCSCQCLVLALIYIDKYAQAKSLQLTTLNIHKLYLTCLLLAAKFIDDVYYDNKIYSHAGGVGLEHLWELEVELFQALDFNISVDEDTYQEYVRSILEYS